MKPHRPGDPVLTTVRALLAWQLGVGEDRVIPEAHLVDTLGADSLDTVEIVMACEEAFGFDVPDEDARRHCEGTVGELVAYVERRLA